MRYPSKVRVLRLHVLLGTTPLVQLILDFGLIWPMRASLSSQFVALVACDLQFLDFLAILIFGSLVRLAGDSRFTLMNRFVEGFLLLLRQQQVLFGLLNFKFDTRKRRSKFINVI